MPLLRPRDLEHRGGRPARGDRLRQDAPLIALQRDGGEARPVVRATCRRGERREGRCGDIGGQGSPLVIGEDDERPRDEPIGGVRQVRDAIPDLDRVQRVAGLIGEGAIDLAIEGAREAAIEESAENEEDRRQQGHIPEGQAHPNRAPMRPDDPPECRDPTHEGARSW